MSAKWIRAQQWEKTHLTGWLTPVRWVLHTLSTVRLAIVLLVLLTIYGILASVPIGMIAQIPTVLLYGLTVLLAIAVLAILPVWLLWRGMSSAGVAFGVRFATAVLTTVVLIIGASLVWYRFVWPSLHYDPITGDGVRFFAAFVEQYKGTTLRRLPGMEMSELEFYAWWPLELILIIFIINMVVTTVRRIEFTFLNIGVLTVHLGIVLLGLGSVYYAAFKQEGDVLLRAGPIDTRTGEPSLGPEEIGFFDNTRTVLRVRQIRTPQQKIDQRIPPDVEWEQRPLSGVPRYNHYNLGAVEGAISSASVSNGDADKGRKLLLEVPDVPPPTGHPPLVDRDIAFRVVGYSAYGDLVEAWRPTNDPAVQNPVRFIDVLSSVASPGEKAPSELRTIERFGLAPRLPTNRAASLGDAINIEVFDSLPQARWEELAAPLPDSALHGLIVEVPATESAPGLSRVYGVREGQTIDANGYRIVITDLAAEPPFPIITPGYRGAISSLAIARVTTPSGEVFERYCYSRFPELNQDLVSRESATGETISPPRRRQPSSAIRLTYIDSSRVHVYFDHTGKVDASGRTTARAMVRIPGRPVALKEDLVEGDKVELGPMAAVRLGKALASAERIGVPKVVPPISQEKDNIGNHRRAAIAVEVLQLVGPDADPSVDASVKWKTTAWLPFRQYFGLETSEGAQVRLPDGRVVELVFGRRWHQLPGMSLALKRFEMFPYPHSDQARDFRSDLIVRKFGPGGEVIDTEAATSLNEPLLESPYAWHEGNGFARNVAGFVASKLGPMQYKFSQNGWDPTGWNESKARVARGEQARPSARFTILGVGNNPGIYVIALGSLCMALGTPWAFYIKPWLIRRKKAEIQATLAAQGKLPPKKQNSTQSPPSSGRPRAAAEKSA